MPLPKSEDLPIELLAACFDKTTATYKFYWLLSILQAIEGGNVKLKKRALFSGMIANAWWVAKHPQLFFGKQDLIPERIKTIGYLESIGMDEKKEVVYQKIISTENIETKKLLWHFNRNVPHWFLSPWFPKNRKESESMREKRIYSQSQVFESKCLYALDSDFIEINPEWVNYLNANAEVLKAFCLRSLAVFLQSRNPNISDIFNTLNHE